MKFAFFLLPLALTITSHAWEGTDLSFDSPINCNYQKTSTPDDKNIPYQKCLTYKTIYEKYRPFVKHYNFKNKLDEKYTMKFHNIWAEYKYKNHLFASVKEEKALSPQSLEYKRLFWEQDALWRVYSKLEVTQPRLRNTYYQEVREWFKNGEGKKLSDHGLQETHKLRQINVKEGKNMRYQYRMNSSYTSLKAIEEELRERGLPFTEINFKTGF